MGSVVGEKFVQGIQQAIETNTPYIRRQLMLRGDFSSSGAELTGVGAMTPDAFSMRVLEGDLRSVMSQRFHVALGEMLARNLGVGVGDTIDASSDLSRRMMLSSLPPLKSMQSSFTSFPTSRLPSMSLRVL